MPDTPLEEAAEMHARAEALAVRVRQNDEAILGLSTEDLEALRKDLADSVAVTSATIAEIKTLIAQRESG